MPTRGEANLSAAAGGLVVRLGRMASARGGTGGGGERRAHGRKERAGMGVLLYTAAAPRLTAFQAAPSSSCDLDSVPVVRSRGGRPR